jgi:hypothetical protein
MNTYKTKLLQNIEAMREKLASMEDELNKLETIKHFPSEGEIYYYYTSSGAIRYDTATNDDILVNVYKTYGEAEEELWGQNTYLMYFYYGEEKYVVTGRVEEKKLQDIVIEYKNTIVNNCDNK